MAHYNHIGIESEKAEELKDKLNNLLADYTVFYINTRGFHWNIKGDKFFELHVKFEELYNALFLKIDEIAERILTLGFTPLHSYSEFLKHAEVREAHNVSDGTEAIRSILSSFAILIKKQRDILSLSGEADDEGTNALMSDYIREQEKLIWMYKAYLNE